jgi:hypothetical protein
MRIPWIAIALLIGCQADLDGPDGPASPGADESGTSEVAATDHLKEIFDQVDGTLITQRLREMAGVVPVTVNGASITLGQRFDAAGRGRFRDYWSQTMRNLGLEITPFHFTASPRAGDNVEAVLRGPSADSVVVIVHYDSIGPRGRETSNPGADDDMSGMSIMLETARLLVAHKAQLQFTVRFVISDMEELGGLAGARNYAQHIQAQAAAEGFRLIAWNCSTAGLCGDNLFPAFDIFSCSTGNPPRFTFPALGDQFAAIVASYSTLHVKRNCIGASSDHFAMWEIGVPAVVYSEHNPFANPHFDQSGGDTFARIDTAYLTSIARPAIAFQAALAGVQK